MTDDHSRVARITLAGPGANLLNPENMAATIDALLVADREPQFSGIVITGAGDVFCGGLDVGAIRDGGDPVEFAGSLVRLLQLFPKLSKPVVARVNGNALASGASIVAACDYAAAVSTARIGTFEVSIGIWPMVAQVPLIKRLGARAAMENIGSGEPFSSSRALELGLVNMVGELDELDPLLQRWLDNASRGGAAVAAGRPSLYELAELPYEQALDSALAKFGAMFKEN